MAAQRDLRGQVETLCRLARLRVEAEGRAERRAARAEAKAAALEALVAAFLEQRADPGPEGGRGP